MRMQDRRSAAAPNTTGGCVYGLLHFLNYHHLNWHNVKRVLPHKKQHATHPLAGVENDNLPLDYHHEEEIRHEELDEELQGSSSNSTSHEERSSSVKSDASRTTNSTRTKRSIKSRIKALISEKEHDSKSKRVGVSEPPNSHREETSSTTNKPDNKYYHNSSSGGAQSNFNNSSTEVKHDADIFEVFKVNKQIFLKILNDRDIAAIQSLDNRTNTKSAASAFSLTKSGSFPAPNSSTTLSARFKNPSKLEHKQKEVWPQLKGINTSDIETFFSQERLPCLDNDNNNKSDIRPSVVDRYAAELFDAILKKEMRKSLSSRSLKLGSDGEPIMSSRSLKLVGSDTDRIFSSTAELTVPPRTFRRRFSTTDIDYCSVVPVDGGGAERKSDAERSAGVVYCEEDVNKMNKQEPDDNAVVGILEPLDNPADTCVGDDDRKGNKESSITCTTEEGPQDTIACCSNAEELLEVEDRNSDHVLVDDNFKADFCYVKIVLGLLGLTTKDQLTVFTWHTFDQPLSPSLFEEIETQYFSHSIDQQSSFSVKTFDEVNARKLLFDLVNKALVELDEKSCVYYPKALSYSCHVQPMSKGRRNWVLDEVWASVVHSLDWKVDSNASLDVIVGKDLYSGNDGWMNLQMESECIGLELEDFILDDLLDDIILSCY